MINQLELLFHPGRPDVSAPDVIALLRQVTRAERWARWATALIGGLLLAGSVILMVPPGDVTPAGWIAVVLLFGTGLLSLRFYRVLMKDIRPYALPPEALCRYTVAEGRITRFGPQATFGSRENRYERLHWAVERPRPMKGRTPYVYGALSVWLDYDDPVWVGLDPAGEHPPIFLGVSKPAPAVLLQPKADVKAVYLALQEHFRGSRRWKGKALPYLWNA